MKKIKKFFSNILLWFKREQVKNNEIKELKDAVYETKKLCDEMKSFLYLVEVTKVQQQSLQELSEQVSFYERILSNKSQFVDNDSNYNIN